MLYQELSGEHLSDSIMLVSVLNGLQESARHFLLFHLDGHSSFSALENLLAIYFSTLPAEQESSLNVIADKAGNKKGEQNRVNDQESNTCLQQKQEQDKPDQLVKGGRRKGKGKGKGEAYNPQPPANNGKGKPNQLPNNAQRACRDKPEETKGKGQESNPSFKRELEQRGKRKAGRGETKDKKQEVGEAYPPQPQAYKGKGKQQQLPARQWCSFCWKKGHNTQACWWNSSAQQHRKHPKQQTWRQKKKKQLQRDNGAQSFAQWLASTESLMRSLERETQQDREQLESFADASSAKAWAILVDTGAATSIAPKSFAPHLELSPAPSTLQLSTATGEAIKIFGLRDVHLQCQDLSFKVSFVIADVVTPTLSLDTMLVHSLILSF